MCLEGCWQRAPRVGSWFVLLPDINVILQRPNMKFGGAWLSLLASFDITTGSRPSAKPTNNAETTTIVSYDRIALSNWLSFIEGIYRARDQKQSERKKRAGRARYFLWIDPGTFVVIVVVVFDGCWFMKKRLSFRWCWFDCCCCQCFRWWLIVVVIRWQFIFRFLLVGRVLGRSTERQHCIASNHSRATEFQNRILYTVTYVELNSSTSRWFRTRRHRLNRKRVELLVACFLDKGFYFIYFIFRIRTRHAKTYEEYQCVGVLFARRKGSFERVRYNQGTARNRFVEAARVLLLVFTFASESNVLVNKNNTTIVKYEHFFDYLNLFWFLCFSICVSWLSFDEQQRNTAHSTEGHLFCKECIFTSLLQQKKDIQVAQAKWDEEQRKREVILREIWGRRIFLFDWCACTVHRLSFVARNTWKTNSGETTGVGKVCQYGAWRGERTSQGFCRKRLRTLASSTTMRAHFAIVD